MAEKIPGALGKASHREGRDTLALGDYSHAEGNETQAQGESSHAEGTYTASIGISSHAEGSFSVATGQEAHAEGHGTIAKNFAQHAEGIYNKGEANDTVHETGIGTSDSDRKNAFEIFYDGVIKFPELSFSQQKEGSKDIAVTVNYIEERERLVSKEDEIGVIELDFSKREVNYRVDIKDNTHFLRPKNLIPGKTGDIEFFNQTLDPKNISFDSYWAYRLDGSYGNTEIISGNYSKLTISYRAIDENTIEYDIVSEYIPHLPLMVSNDPNFSDFLLVNESGDYLIS